MFNNSDSPGALSAALSCNERDDEVPTTTTAVVFSMSNSQSLSRRTRLLKGDNLVFKEMDHIGQVLLMERLKFLSQYPPGSGSSFDGPDEEKGTLELYDEATSDGHRVNGDLILGSIIVRSYRTSCIPAQSTCCCLLYSIN
ncbi:exocyst complex component SEC8 [Prunus yedoensis var. nudiflora]|uniref:Exocyst complex component SEC8 n=1 Tax=Prunus yedoensis var. nudiflora TaxID=2094558 RepID=A0A314ZBF3_PRUYE|nr:exocyst complex component SEC8 [Prunus yedoensis var. nudiflora]